MHPATEEECFFEIIFPWLMLSLNISFFCGHNVIFLPENSDFELQIVEVLTESLTLKETLIPTKVARLMLVSDVLHNSSAPVRNASAYRTKFEATLPDIMESFNDLYRSVTGRITAEALKVGWIRFGCLNVIVGYPCI